jgi:hypothetical protein
VNFPLGNRIIAGMPLGEVIVEGKQTSESLITVRLAMEFGREVFGVPRNAAHPDSGSLDASGGHRIRAVEFARFSGPKPNMQKDLRVIEHGACEGYGRHGRNHWVEFQRSSRYAL